LYDDTNMYTNNRALQHVKIVGSNWSVFLLVTAARQEHKKKKRSKSSSRWQPLLLLKSSVFVFSSTLQQQRREGTVQRWRASAAEISTWKWKRSKNSHAAHTETRQPRALLRTKVKAGVRTHKHTHVSVYT